MKKHIINTIKVFGITALFVSCGNLDTMNTDPNAYYTTKPEALLTYAEKGLADYLSTPSVNSNNFRLMTQYWQETTYTDESNYDFVTRNIANNVWATYYRDVMQNIVQAKSLINAYTPPPSDLAAWPAIKANQLAILDMQQVFVYQNLVDTFGDVPYQSSNDLSNNPLPKYMKAADIYVDLITRLKADISSLDTSSSSFGSADIFYAGNVSKWKTFGNSLLLKLGITIADVNNSLAQSTVNAAISGGVMTSSADDCLFKYLTASPNYSQLYANFVASNRNDFVAGKTLVDYMNAKSDARRFSYFSDNVRVSMGKLTSFDSFGVVTVNTLPTDPTNLAGYNVYVTHTYSDDSEKEFSIGKIASNVGTTITLNNIDTTGIAVNDPIAIGYFVGATIGSGASFSSKSHMGSFAYATTTPAIIMNYTEVAFYLAEAAARWGTSDAAAAYSNAITASFLQWGLTSSDAGAYIAGNPYSASTWKKSIGEQAWVAMFDQGSTSWNFWRRLDYPVLVAPSTAVSQAEGKVPVRITYPVRETTTNPTNYAAGAASIGGDKLGTKIFWDVN